MKPAELIAVERAGKTLWVEPGVPERLVHVDVPEAGQGPLVEQRGLQRGAAPLQPLAQSLRREGGDERLLAETRPEVRLELARLEQQPGAETPDIAVGDLAAVVERQQRAPVRVARERVGPQRAGHAEVDQQRTPRREPDDQVLPATVDVLDALSGQLRGDDQGSSGRVSRMSLISTCSSRRPSSAGAMLPYGFDLR